MKKLTLNELESSFPVLDPEASKTIKGGLSVTDILEAINNGQTWVDNCTFNFANGVCTSVLFEGNYIDIRTFSPKDMLADGGGGSDEPVAWSYTAPIVVVHPRSPFMPSNTNDYLFTASWNRLTDNPFRNGGMDLSEYYSGGTSTGHNMRVALNYIQSLADNHIPYRQEGGSLRTSDSPAGLAYMDCSELVCRYFAKMGFISDSVQAMNSLAIRQYAERHPDMLTRVRDEDFPRTGDIFLWHRSDTDGHTGIVKSYDPNTRMVTVLEEYSYGDVHEAREIAYRIDSRALMAHDGWEGFYRPNVN